MEGVAGDEGLDELAQGEVFFLRAADDAGGEVFVAEAAGAAEDVFDERFGERLGVHLDA